MQMSALQIAPIFRAIGPDYAKSQPEWILCIVIYFRIVKIIVCIISSEKWAACTLLVVCVVSVIANVDVVVLEQFVLVNMLPRIAIV